MWNRVVEMPGSELDVGEILSLLQCVLTESELEEFAEEALRVCGSKPGLVEPFEYEADA